MEQIQTMELVQTEVNHLKMEELVALLRDLNMMEVVEDLAAAAAVGTMS